MGEPNLVGNVRLQRRRNADQSITCYLRWYTQNGEAKPKGHTHRLFRTEANPTKTSLREWDKIAHRNVYVHQRRMLDMPATPRTSRRVPLKTAYAEYVEVLYGMAPHSATPAARDRTIRLFLDWITIHNAEVKADIWEGYTDSNDRPVLEACDIRQCHVAGWRDDRMRKVAGSTLATECSYLQGWFDWLLEHEMIGVHLRAMTAQARQRIARSGDRSFLTDETVRKLLATEDTVARRALAVMAGTGMRVGEMRVMYPSWWLASDRLLEIPRLGTQTRKMHQRRVPVGPFLAGLLQEESDYSWIGEKPRRWLAAVGGTPHDMRRWYATTLVRLGCPDVIRRLLMGHALAGTDAPYVDPDVSGRREWAEKVDSVVASLWPS